LNTISAKKLTKVAYSPAHVYLHHLGWIMSEVAMFPCPQSSLPVHSQDH